MVWRAEDPQGSEAQKILWELPLYTRGRGLDIGCGPRKAYQHFIGVDSTIDHELFGTPIDPDIKIADAVDLSIFGDKSMDFVFSSHLLEHIKDYPKALAEWWRLIKPDGHLVLYLPHKSFYPNIGKEGANPDHKHDFMPDDIISAMRKVGSWDLLRNEDRNEGVEYSFFQVYKKLGKGGGHKFSCRDPKPAKTCAIVRYGAWGDALQMTSILPALKEQGYHITLYTTPRAHEVVKHDHRIDAFYIQDTDQVPNEALPTFWKNEEKKYTRWINLSESVEGTWLALGDRPGWHARPQKVRMKYLSKVNYLEFHHDLADIPFTKPQIKFTPTLAERNWAALQKKEIGGKPLIMYVLNGSAVHKVWPHMDPLFARLFTTYPGCKIVTVGDKSGKSLTAPWQKEPRVVRTEGDWSIRQTLTFAEICDLVIGPETGVMSSVAMLPMPKIVFLSHSSHDNLTKGWENTYALFSLKTPCYPCNMMHYGWTHCKRNEDKDQYWNGTAQCQVDITPDHCWAAVTSALSTEVSNEIQRVIARSGSAVDGRAGPSGGEESRLPQGPDHEVGGGPRIVQV